MEILETYDLNVFLSTYSTRVIKHKERFIIGSRALRRTASFNVVSASPECAGCGLKATQVQLRKTAGKVHLQIATGDVAFTKDHIIPKAKGGINALSNYQTMCAPCNNLKGTKSDANFKARVVRVKYWEDTFKPFSWWERLIFTYL